MDRKEIVRKGYNKIALEYLNTRTDDSEDVLLLHELVKRLPKGAHVLDAGCGAGVPVTKFLSEFFEVTGVDFAETQIQLARTLVPNAHFLCEDITCLTFPDHFFDALCSYYALIHIPREEHEVVLQNFHRMVKPSGLLLVCMGSESIEEDLGEYHGAKMYWSHYDADTNIRLVEDCGFTIIWSKIVRDSTDPEATHLFVLGKRS